MASQKGLGKGLGALLGDFSEEPLEKSAYQQLPIYKVEPNPDQPRQDFDEEELQALADSIAVHGIIQPLTVREMPNGYYQIIAGERRWRAARMANLSDVPAVIIEADDKKAMELALIENLQRQDLNPLEEALGYQTLMNEYGLTQEEAAGRVGKSRPAVANALRLLGLCPEVQERVRKGELSAGHARAILQLKSEKKQQEAAQKIVALGLSVRQAELLCKNMSKEPAPQKKEVFAVDYVAECEKSLSKHLGRGVKLAGSGFWMYKGMGARLEWALLNYFIDCHIADGYEFILPPHMLEYQCGETAGQFPKFADEVYKIANPTDDRVHYMLPTAEAALCSIYRDEILTEAELPRKFFAYTPCFRREAGSGHADERGMVRGHQFNKVEMFQFTRPEDSDAAFEELVRKAENLVKGLGFHFRTVKLAAGDCSASMARTYDIEIQIPSMNGYKEVSSVSNARDYQARRGNIRFRREATGKPEFVHTLNGSGLATSRIFPAMVEQNQRADGSVVVPEVLRKYLGGIEVIEKK